MRTGAPVETHTGGETLVVSIRQAIWDGLVARKDQPDWSNACSIATGLAGPEGSKQRIAGIETARIYGRTLSWPESLHLLANISLRRVQFPTHAVIERHIRPNLPAVLREEIDGLASYQFMLRRSLRHIGR